MYEGYELARSWRDRMKSKKEFWEWKGNGMTVGGRFLISVSMLEKRRLVIEVSSLRR
jgi:hypothetical protein